MATGCEDSTSKKKKKQNRRGHQSISPSIAAMNQGSKSEDHNGVIREDSFGLMGLPFQRRA